MAHVYGHRPLMSTIYIIPGLLLTTLPKSLWDKQPEQKLYIPSLASIVQKVLISSTSRGWDTSNPRTDEVKPSIDKSKSSGLFHCVLASWADNSAKPATLSACSRWVLERPTISVLKVFRRFNNSALSFSLIVLLCLASLQFYQDDFQSYFSTCIISFQTSSEYFAFWQNNIMGMFLCQQIKSANKVRCHI